MATLSPGLFTYAEWAVRHDSSGKLSELVDMLSQNNGIIDDVMAAECQSGNAFEFTQVTKLPTPSRRSYNTGVPRTMGGVAKLIQTCSEYADWSTIDYSLGRLNGNTAELRMREDALHMEGLSQQFATDLFYANRALDPTQFTGFFNIYNTVSTATSQIANNVIDGQGTGSTNASIMLVNWGAKHLHTIFPNGMPSGMIHEDHGVLPITDTNNNEYLAYRTWIQFNVGLCIHDWRYGVRACNLDVTLFGSGSAPPLISILAAMVYKPPTMPTGVAPVQGATDSVQEPLSGRPAFYLNRTLYLALDLQAQNKSNLLLRMEEWDGHVVMTYRTVPFRTVDAMTNAESRVV